MAHLDPPSRWRSPEPLPRKLPLGTVFMWRGRMWRRGKGILYVAHPADPTIERAYRRREKRRWERRLRKERRREQA